MVDWILDMVGHKPTTVLWRLAWVLIAFFAVFTIRPWVNSVISENPDVVQTKASVAAHDTQIHDLQNALTQQAQSTPRIFTALQKISDGQDQSNQRLSALEAKTQILLDQRRP